ncbi:unnamed protein product [Trifolium pratense]|uniref:Uncharacterized protein n=1 Tax=Trifolium pratense TaxID=57577 RepID=A0ACB0IES9_TRIPR|nr:unnamed protein product [Trifolium pratense]
MLLGNGYKEDCPASFSCGYLGNISFPFTTTERPDCGLLPIPNCGDAPLTPKMIQFENKGKQFELKVEYVNPLEYHGGNATCSSVFRDKNLYKLLQNKSCEAFRYNYTLPPTTHFVSFHMETHGTLFMCNRTLHVKPPAYMHKYTKCPLYDLYYQPYDFAYNASQSAFTDCTNVQLPIKDFANGDDPFAFATANIPTQVSITKECSYCHYNQRGRCQLDSNRRFYCAEGTVSKKKGLSRNVKLGIAVMTAVGVATLMLLAYRLRKKIFPPTFLLFMKDNPTHQIIEKFLKERGPLPAARYNYSDIKKITNSFKNKLGQGGYGSVYKGKLHDECMVAVKVLSESKGDGEDFINEVASISRTSHVNVVRLLGFCLDGSKKALIYELVGCPCVARVL